MPQTESFDDRRAAAEATLSAVRLATVALSALVFLFMPRAEGAIVPLAHGIIVVSFAYALLMLHAGVCSWLDRAARPAASIIEGALMTAWIFVTGGAESPFFVLYFASLATIAYRFNMRETLLAASVYALTYAGILAGLGELFSHAAEVALRIGTIFILAYIAGRLARENLAQGIARIEMQDRAVVAEASEAKFRGLLEAAPDAIVIADRESRIALVNSQAERLFGFQRAEMLGQPITLLLPERFHGAIKASLRGLQESGPRLREASVLTMSAQRKNGAEFPVEIGLSPIEGEEGFLATSVIRDLSTRNATLLALQESEERFRRMAEAAFEGIFVQDGTELVDVNGPGAEMLGYGREELIGRSAVQLAAPESRELVADNIRRGYEGRYEAFVLHKDGHAIPVEIRGRAIPSRGRQLRITSIRDMSERKRAEEERLAGLERLRELERLKEVDRFKTQFINTAAHELGTPITPIKLQLHLLRGASGAGLPPEQKRSVAIVDRNNDRLATLVQDMLDVARLQASRLGVSREATDLDRIVHEAVESFQEQARQKRVTLSLERTGEVVVDADAKRITQVLFNLLSNALKFTPEGGRVTASLQRRGDVAVVAVRDTGVGIRPADAAKLFQPFSQVHDPMERTISGTGLGLYISRGIIELHGGKIWSESPGLGAGATFAFELPLTPRDAAQVLPRERAPRHESPISRRARELI